MSTLYLLVGVDAEPDNPGEGRSPARPTFTNIHALPALHDRLTRYGVRPTYFVTRPVVADPSSVAVIQGLMTAGTCEVGVGHDPTQAASYVPHDSRLSHEAVCTSPTRFAEQLESLTDAVETVTGSPPVSYRGGSGFCAAHVSILERLGYQVGSTVTPWRFGPEAGSSSVGAPLTPYYLSYDDVRQPGSSDVLEVPTTCMWSRPLPAWLASTLARVARHPVSSRFLRAGQGVHLIELRPSSSSLGDMIAAARRLRREPPYILNVVCTSSDGVVGGSRTNVSEAHLDRFFDRLESFLRFVTEELDAVPLTFSEFRADWCSPSTEGWRSTAVLGFDRTASVVPEGRHTP